MDLYEHQARELFKAHGIPVPDAAVVAAPREARAPRNSSVAASWSRPR